MPHLSAECHLLNGFQLPFPWVYSSYPSFFPLLSVSLFCPLVCHLTAALNCTISHVSPVHPGQERMACPKLGLSFPHYPEPCHQKASTFLQVQPHPTCERESHILGYCRSFNGPEPGGSESKREKEADVPWFPRKANRALLLGLALLHVGTGRPLQG